MATRKKQPAVKGNSSMPERMNLILELLEEGRRDTNKQTEVLNQVLVKVASIERAHDAHRDALQDVRVLQGDHEKRIRTCERSADKQGDLEHRQTTLRSDLSRIDSEVRSLQNANSANSVTVSTHSNTWRYVGTAVGGAILALAVKLLAG